MLLPWLVVPVVSLLVIVAALALLLALVDVFNRDLRFVLNNLMTVWFFLVPIVYTQRMTDEHLRFLSWIDPMAWVIKQFQQLLYWGEPLSVASVVLVPLAAVVIFGAGLVIFRRATIGLAKFV